MSWRRLLTPVATALARFGLVARAAFYLLLVYLVVLLAVGAGGRQANAHGALATVASHPAGLAAIVATAAGFLAFGGVRVRAAITDDAPPWWRRAMTLAQGLFYVALTWVPMSYALGNRSSGSEQQQHKTTTGLLHLPAGREIVFALGLVVIGVCASQIRTGLGQDYADGMQLGHAPPVVQRLVRISGTVGIPARAAVFVPMGVFFMIAAVQADPRHADGLDRELAALSGHAWGVAVLALIAAGLFVFAVYSLLEARYRSVTKGE